MDNDARKLERLLRSSGFDEEVFGAYMRAMKRSGVQMCGCESSLCEKIHVYNPKYGPIPGEAQIDNEPVNPGFCINPVDHKVKVEYVQMCDECAQQLPEEWHLDDCECSTCSVKPESPQDQVAGYLDENGDFISDEEPDPTEDGWHEDWESDEFEDDEDLDHQRRDY